MIPLVTALAEVVADLIQAIRHAAAGDEEAAFASALLAQRRLSDAIAAKELK